MGNRCVQRGPGLLVGGSGQGGRGAAEAGGGWGAFRRGSFRGCASAGNSNRHLGLFRGSHKGVVQ